MSAFCLKDNSHSSSWKIAKMSSFSNIVMWYLVLSGIKSRIQIFNKNAFLSIFESLDIMLGERPLPQRQQSQKQLKNSQNVKFFNTVMWYFILARIQYKIRKKNIQITTFYILLEFMCNLEVIKREALMFLWCFCYFYHVFKWKFYIFSINFSFILM